MNERREKGETKSQVVSSLITLHLVTFRSPSMNTSVLTCFPGLENNRKQQAASQTPSPPTPDGHMTEISDVSLAAGNPTRD